MVKPDRQVILVLGSSGFLGQRLCPMLESSGHTVLRQTRRPANGPNVIEIELASASAIARRLDECRPSVIVNLAALTNVDLCEKDVATAYACNAGIVANIAGAVAAAKSPAHLIQISTDQVYQGDGPHLEADVNPVNVYALTKLTGELLAARAKATILRTNFVGPSHLSPAKGLSDWVYDELRAGRRITGFDDVLFSPLDIGRLCENIIRVIATPHAGTFNLGSLGGCSKGEFCRRLADLCGLDQSLIDRGYASSGQLVARRPNDMRMRVDAFEAQFGAQLPTTDRVIQALAKEYREQA